MMVYHLLLGLLSYRLLHLRSRRSIRFACLLTGRWTILSTQRPIFSATSSRSARRRDGSGRVDWLVQNGADFTIDFVVSEELFPVVEGLWAGTMPT
jgi:hypothetical protein